jgi:hypothetical protein
VIVLVDLLFAADSAVCLSPKLEKVLLCRCENMVFYISDCSDLLHITAVPVLYYVVVHVSR